MGSGQSKSKNAIAVTAVGIGLYALYKLLNKKDNNIPQQNINLDEPQALAQTFEQPQEIQLQALNEDFPNDENLDVMPDSVSKIKIVLQNGHLDYRSIFLICEASIDVVGNSYAKETNENRIRRRQLKKQGKLNDYITIIQEYNERIENYLEKAQERVCAFVGTTYDIFQESVVTLMEQGYYQQFFMIQASIRQKIKEKIPSSKNVDLATTKQILKFQIGLLQSDQSKRPEEINIAINKFSGNPETSQIIPLVINVVLSDYIFEKFQIEEEDQIKVISNPQIMQDQEMQQLFYYLEQSMMQLLGPLNLQPGMDF
ncbi:hypothetical protein pb186bvf_016830 [Paramecium bursaria]